MIAKPKKIWPKMSRPPAEAFFENKSLRRPYRAPNQAKTHKNRAKVKKYKKKAKIQQDISKLGKELGKLERDIERKKLIQEMMAQAPTPAEQRKMMYVMFAEAGYNPIQAMIEMAQNEELPAKDLVGLHKELASYLLPKQKSIDIQQNVSGGVEVKLIDFSKVSQAQLADSAIDADIVEGDYTEFEAPEDSLAEAGDAALEAVDTIAKELDQG